MKKSIILTLFLFAFITLCFGGTPVDSTAVFSIGGFHVTWTLIAAILVGIEGVLRALPTGKYASLLGLIHWLDNYLPSKEAPPKQ